MMKICNDNLFFLLSSKRLMSEQQQQQHLTFTSRVFHICEQPFPTERVFPFIRMKYNDFTDDEKNLFHLVVNYMNSRAGRGRCRWLTEPLEINDDFKLTSQIILSKIDVNDIPNINSPNYEYYFDLKMYDRDFEEELLIPFCYARYIHNSDDSPTFMLFCKDQFEFEWNYISTCHLQLY